MPFTTRHTSSASPAALLSTVAFLPSTTAAHRGARRRRCCQHRRCRLDPLAAGVSLADGIRQLAAAAISAPCHEHDARERASESAVL
jgi:hypothetical protein